MALDRLEAEQAVGDAVVAKIVRAQCVVEQRVAVEANHTIGGVHPEPAGAILREAHNRSTQRFNGLTQAADPAGLSDGNPPRGADPDVAPAIFEQ